MGFYAPTEIWYVVQVLADPAMNQTVVYSPGSFIVETDGAVVPDYPVLIINGSVNTS